MKKFQNKNNGFTFLELIIYIAIITVVLSSLVRFAWSAIGNSVKSTTQQEVYASARYVSERIKYEIRNANGINEGSSTFDASPGVLSLVQTAPDNPTVIDLSAGEVRIKQGAAAAVNLNSTDTTVTSLVFTNYSSGDNKTKHIGFTMTITSNYGSVRQEYTDTVTLRSSAEVRSN